MAKLNKKGQIEFDEEENKLFEPGQQHFVEVNKMIPELSDEEIEVHIKSLMNGESYYALYIEGFKDGMKAYREQLKQRQ